MSIFSFSASLTIIIAMLTSEAPLEMIKKHSWLLQDLVINISFMAEICYISSVALYYTQQRLSIYLLKPQCSSALGVNVTLCFLQSSESLMPTVTSDQCEHTNHTEAPESRSDPNQPFSSATQPASYQNTAQLSFISRAVIFQTHTCFWRATLKL